MSDLLTIFNQIKPLLKAYESPLIARSNYESRYELWSEKSMEVAGRKRKDVFFASIIIQSNYVGFYYMPVYTDAEAKEFFKPELLKMLKGKSCFHLKKELDNELLAQIAEVLEKGFALYKIKGWI